jgi:Golgi apparatus protein 1
MAENIDFQFPMKQACGADIQRFCKTVEAGHAKVIRCLEDNLEQPGFNATCKAEVQKHTANAATDYRWPACACRLCRCMPPCSAAGRPHAQ